MKLHQMFQKHMTFPYVYALNGEATNELYLQTKRIPKFYVAIGERPHPIIEPNFDISSRLRAMCGYGI